MGKCWWCGKEADSREHKYKKSDLLREFGRGPYQKNKAIVRVFGGKQYSLQGPDSLEAKFKKSLCSNCNSVRSRPFDAAYDIFVSYIRTNEKIILSTGQFKFSDIFGSQWKSQRNNLIRYFVKHICCRLDEVRIPIEPELILFLNGSQNLKYIGMKFEIREDIANMLDQINTGAIWIGDLVCMKSESTGEISDVQSFYGYRWLRLNYIYDMKIGNFKSNFEEDCIKLDFYYNIPPSEINVFKSKNS